MTASPDQLFDQAVAAYQTGDRAHAGALAKKIIAVAPNHGDALNLSAILAQEGRDLAQAETLARRAVETAATNPIYLNTLGTTLLAQGRTSAAVEALRKAATAAPQEPEILFNLANALRDFGAVEDALNAYQNVIAAKPGHLGAYNNLALLMKASGDPQGAVTVLIEAIAHAPTAAELRFNLGNALHLSHQLEPAVHAFQKALSLKPDHVQAMVNLGVVFSELGRKPEAEKMFKAAIARDPDLSQAYVGLADLVDDGSFDAVAHRRAVLAMRPNLAAIRSSLLMCLHYADSPTPAEIAAEHRTYGEMFDRADAPAYERRTIDWSPSRKLKIGVVSGDFRFHAMLFFALPLFEAREKAAWDLTCYSTTAKTDLETNSFRAAADHWRDVRHLSAGDLADLVVRDGIDVLIDLSGHAPHNRLLTFAAKPAPLQVAWGDYVDTRGLKAIDILIGDGVHTPDADDGRYVERVVRMPGDYICYRPPANVPPVASAPVMARGAITFGCFSEVTKIGPAAVVQWAEMLRAVPDSRMFFNNYLFADGARQGRLISLCMENGLPTDRISFGTGGTHAEFLAQYAEVDIVLDTTPYSGGLTTCEALLMGVPLLTVPGERFCGRHAAAHLINGGYSDGVCSSVADMAGKAKALAADPDKLNALRRALRAKFLKSRVCDVAGHARDFYGILRAEWQTLSKAKAN
ncbi:MAG: tetratricopeptide repeat protein [Rhodobacteraceae bacterium]|nr:tetratricopeptide repeat protein [Paracoccaceae bacterium]